MKTSTWFGLASWGLSAVMIHPTSLGFMYIGLIGGFIAAAILVAKVEARQESQAALEGLPPPPQLTRRPRRWFVGR